MPILSSRKLLWSALFAGAASLTLAAMPAFAQSDERDETASLNKGEIQVQAPRLHVDRGRVNGTIQKVSASIPVDFADLDLRTRSGARELRMRVRDAAQDVCAQLADAYPFYEANGTSCYKTALNDGLVRANEAIDSARQYHREYYASNDDDY